MKKILIASLIIVNLFIALPATVQAVHPIRTGSDAADKIDSQTNALLNTSPYEREATVGGIAATVISVILSLLGIIFVILLIYGGILWMTAAGNEDQIRKAMDLIKAAVIGLIIVVSAYSITYFVFSSLNNATTENGSLG